MVKKMKKVFILLLIMFDGTAFAVAENHEGDTTVVEKQAELQEVKVMGYRRIAQDDAKKTVYQLSRTLPKNTTTDVALKRAVQDSVSTETTGPAGC